MSPIYYYSIGLLLFGLIIQQLFYITKKYSQQNIQIIEYYLNTKLVDKLLKTLLYDFEKNEIRNLIKKYYYLNEIITYKVQDKKFELQNYDAEILKNIVEKIELLKISLEQSKSDHLYNINNIDNIFGIYFRSKEIMLFIVKKESNNFNEIELGFLESIILPLFILKE